MRQKTSQLALDFAASGEFREAQSEGLEPSAALAAPAALARDVMEAVVTSENMSRALKRVRENKGSPGVDGMTVHELPAYLKEAWPQLKQSLLEGTYRPQPVKRVQIPKPGGGMRELGIPTVVDRLIQQALLQVLSPLYEPTFSEHSYGFRPGRNAHQAVKAAREYVSSGRHYVVDLDLEKFFDRVNHDILLSRLARRIGDKRVLGLIRRSLGAGVMQNGVVCERYEGTPQGGPLSPLLANVLLDELDIELTRRGHAFCRYADDCNIYVRSRRAGERVLASVTEFLAKRLRLQVNREKSGVDHPWERKFLGFRIYRSSTGEIRLDVAPQALDRAKGRIREITGRNRGIAPDRLLRELRTFTDGWVQYFHVIRSPGVFVALDKWIRRRLRCYRWVQWKTSRRRARELIRRGAEPSQAWATVWKGSGPWRVSRSKAMSVALSNAHLVELGFHSLQARYAALAAS